MEVFMITIQQVFVLFSIILIGFFTMKQNKLDESAVSVLTYVYSTIMLPCSIFKAMQFKFTVDVLTQCGLLILISFIVIFFEFALGHIFNKVTKQPQLDKNLYKYCILFSNFGMMGIPIIEGVFGSEGLFYMSVFILFIRLMTNSYGFLLLQKNTPYGVKISLGMFKNQLIIAMIVGLIVSISAIPVPLPIQNLIDTLAKGNATIGMLVVGMNLAGYPLEKMFKNKLAWSIVAIRLGIIPIFTLFLFKMFNMDLALALVAVVTLGLPCPAFASILTKKYGGNYIRGSQIVLTSTLMSAVTIPVLVWLCNFAYRIE
ncbi:MAG: AEC family transporter [Lachnospiraceae bacterium]|nr:AEC family transporter [Lachnospiraceae bacterium]